MQVNERKQKAEWKKMENSVKQSSMANKKTMKNQYTVCYDVSDTYLKDQKQERDVYKKKMFAVTLNFDSKIKSKAIGFSIFSEILLSCS